MPKHIKRSLRYGQGQIWSQLEDSWILCDKARLHSVLKTAGRLDFQPETYYLSDLSECKEFFQKAALNPDTIWVTKEPTASQGDGITVNPNINDLKDHWLVNPNAPVEDYECKGFADDNIIAQKYITNPLLLEGKKMEIRTYWVIVSVDPLVVIVRDGTVRLTTRAYVNDNWDDPLIHITNTKQQKKADPNYYQTESERKWPLTQLAEYLHTNGKLGGDDPETWLNKIRLQFEERIIVCVKAALPQFLALKSKPGWDGRFEMMGMDVILDDNLHPWLTEMQDGPGLSLDPGVKQHVIPTMIRELVDIVMEVDLTLRSNLNLPFPLRSLGEWRQLDFRQK
jgi:tubulin polyglutamylase TTLL9